MYSGSLGLNQLVNGNRGLRQNMESEDEKETEELSEVQTSVQYSQSLKSITHIDKI